MKRIKRDVKSIFMKYIHFLFLMLFCHIAVASAQQSVVASDGVELNIYHYPAKGQHLALWVAPSYGLRKGHREMAELLAQQGIEVWQVDLVESLFLPNTSTTMRSIKGNYVAEIIRRAHEQTGKKILLISNSYGSIPLLAGVHEWQNSKPTSRYVIGAILFSPNLYSYIPPLGQAPEYMPVVSATNIPIMIFQAGKNSNRGQLGSLLDELQKGGSAAYFEVIRDIAGLFYDELRDPLAQKFFTRMPEKIQRSIPLLEKSPFPLKPVTIRKTFMEKGSGIDSYLREYKGEVRPNHIRLSDANDAQHFVTDYKNKITVINFWATWCPPCVKEIPSLNRLQKKMADQPFQLISINYAEDKATIHEFLKKFDVDYPVLMDYNGEVARQWQVIAYPSTFVIGPDGKIKYGVNAAIEWDTPELIEKMKALLK